MRIMKRRDPPAFTPRRIADTGFVKFKRRRIGNPDKTCNMLIPNRFMSSQQCNIRNTQKTVIAMASTLLHLDLRYARLRTKHVSSGE